MKTLVGMGLVRVTNQDYFFLSSFAERPPFIRIVAVDVVRCGPRVRYIVARAGRCGTERSSRVVDVEFVGGELVVDLDLRDVVCLGRFPSRQKIWN